MISDITCLQQLKDRPYIFSLKTYLSSLEEQKGELVACVILFGSMARGNYSYDSDYDLLIILRGKTDQRFIDRIYDYSLLSEDGRVEPLVYTKEEIEKMFRDFNPLILDGLKDGKVLKDEDDFWRGLKDRFSKLREDKIIEPEHQGWKINI